MATHYKDGVNPYEPASENPYDQERGASDPFASAQGYEPAAYPSARSVVAVPERRRRIWPFVVVPIILAILVCGGIFAYTLKGSAREVKANAQTAMGFISSYVDAAKSGDSELLEQSARGVSNYAHAIRDEVQSPLWSLATVVPVYGSDISSVRTLGDVLVDIADNALMPLAQNSGGLQISNLVSDGAVNVSVVRDLADAFEQVGPVLTRSSETIDALPPAHLEQVSSVIDSVKDKFSTANDVMEEYGPVLPYLPQLLGENGETRTYLVLAENIAELHACGGFSGAVGTLSVTDGHITMGDFTGVTEVMPYDGTRGGASEEERNVFGDRCDVYSGDHNCVADFSRAGKLYHDHWLKATGEDVDGVLSFDPVFLQYMLQFVGGVDTSFGVTVDGTNAASYMLNQCLFWWDPEVCDSFYSEVAKLAFSKILSGLGSVDTKEFLKTVLQSADEGRCIMWLRDEGAQEAMEELGFAWELPHDPAKPLLGVFVNDWSISKCSYYLGVTPSVGEAQQNADGSTSYPVSLTFKNNASRDLLWGYIPSYLKVRRTDKAIRSELDLYEQVFLVAPEGGRIEGVTYEYFDSTYAAPGQAWEEKSYEGLQTLCCYDFYLDAGETCVLSFTVVTSPEATEPLETRTSPLMKPEFGGWA